jgi:release factor glutamine methyltransferase
MQTVETLLTEARLVLVKTDVATPALDARLLLQQVLSCDHAELIAESNHQLTDDQVREFQELLLRRLSGEPVSRILGEREFYGRRFNTSPAVLDPRPDTETLVEACLEHLTPEASLTLLDLGTGSGILAITLLAERPGNFAVATDMSGAALSVARLNAAVWNVERRIAFVESDWFQDVEGTFDLIVSNPPYIPVADIPGLEIEVRDHDPEIALAGGADGLDCYRAIAASALGQLAPQGIVAVEIGAGQENDIITIFAANGFYIRSAHRDLGGHIRCLVFAAKPKRL